MAYGRRTLATVAAALLASAVISATVGAETQENVTLHDTTLPTLYVNYALNCTFTITNDSGAAVTSIAPGAYNVEITTPAQFADAKGTNAPGDFTECQGAVAFQLTGSGVNISTTLDDGSNDHALFGATFAPGQTYVAVDGNQPAVARVSFTTTASGTPVAPPNPYTPGTSPSKPSSSKDVVGSQAPKTVAFRGTLLGTVSAAGKATLKLKGKAVGTLEAGRYTFTVTDDSKSAGFTVQLNKQGATTVTTSAFEGKRSDTLNLKAGQWFFYPSFVGKKTYFFVVN